MIYFIQGNSGTPIKIGYTRFNDVSGRINSLQTGYPWTLRPLFRLLDADKDLERRIHKLFDPERLRGEWFEPSKRLLMFIEQLAVMHVDGAIKAAEIGAELKAEYIGAFWLSESSVPTMFRLRYDVIRKARKAGTAPSAFIRQNGSNTIRYYNVSQVKAWLEQLGVPYAIDWSLARFHLRNAKDIGFSVDVAESA